MPQTIYHYCGDQSHFRDSDYRNLIRREAHAGNVAVKAKSTAELSLERAVDHPVTLTRFFSRNAAEVNWRRTAEIIRDRGGDFVLVRFLVTGTVRTVTSNQTINLLEQHFNLSRGDVPYLSQSLPNASGEHESFQIWVPLHRIALRLPDEGFVGSFSCATPPGATANALMRTLFQHGERLDLALRERLVEALIEALVESVRHERRIQPRRTGIGNSRLATLLQFIQDHAVRPDLSSTIVAQECGISRRYLSALLARDGLQFSEILRKARLDRAESILCSKDAANRTIAEIAQLSGFGSSSYFTRVFKSARGMSPRRFRKDCRRSTDIVSVEGLTWRDMDPPASVRHGNV